jgi:hypothetical protein
MDISHSSESAQLPFKFSKDVANFAFNSEQLNYINSAEIRDFLNSIKTKT